MVLRLELITFIGSCGVLSRRVISGTEKTKEGKFRCPLDGQLFETKADLDRHYRTVHIAEEGLL
jgi:uncharacterized C2H2 Zn-finger protein